MQCIRTTTLPCLFFELFPFVDFSCLGHNFVPSSQIDLKLGMHVYHINTECSAHEPQLHLDKQCILPGLLSNSGVLPQANTQAHTNFQIPLNQFPTPSHSYHVSDKAARGY